MKKIIFLFLLLPELAFGQLKLSDDFTTSVGTPYKVVDANNKQYFADGKGNSISVKTQGKKVTIQQYDVTNMREINRHEYIDIPESSKFEGILRTGEHLYYFYSTPVQTIKRALNVREISLNDGTFQPAKVIVETEGEIAWISPSINSIGIKVHGGFLGSFKFFDIIESTDKSKLMIRYKRKPLSKDNNVNYDVLGFYSFTTDLEKLWGSEFKMPHTEQAMTNLSYGISKDGTVYSLAFITDTKQFELLTMDGNAAIKTSRLDISADFYFQSILITEDQEGNLLCTGYYANGIEYKVSWPGNVDHFTNINGILQFKLNKKGEILEKNQYEFPIALINEFESQRSKNKNDDREEDGKAGILDLKIVTVTTQADGSTFILGEQYYKTTSRVYNITGGSNGPKKTTHYYYADMIATKIDKNGKLLWMVKLPKTQYGINGRGGLGVRYIKGDGTHYLMFVDTKKNATITKNLAPAEYADGSDGYLTAYKINDVDGTFDRLTILYLENVDGYEVYQFATSRIFDVSTKIFMLESYIKGKQDTMIKMQLKK
jgi:hypothetical protein